MHIETTTPTTVRRFVDPDDLVCPGCGDRAIGTPYLELLRRSP